MPPIVALLLAATDDATLLAAVSRAGGTERAVNALFDEAHRLQLHGGSHE
jgi:hypothetical protein